MTSKYYKDEEKVGTLSSKSELPFLAKWHRPSANGLPFVSLGDWFPNMDTFELVYGEKSCGAPPQQLSHKKGANVYVGNFPDDGKMVIFVRIFMGIKKTIVAYEVTPDMPVKTLIEIIKDDQDIQSNFKLHKKQTSKKKDKGVLKGLEPGKTLSQSKVKNRGILDLPLVPRIDGNAGVDKVCVVLCVRACLATE